MGNSGCDFLIFIIKSKLIMINTDFLGSLFFISLVLNPEATKRRIRRDYQFLRICIFISLYFHVAVFNILHSHDLSLLCTGLPSRLPSIVER